MKRLLTFSIVALFTILMIGCSKSEDTVVEKSETKETETTTVTDFSGRTVTFKEKPKRVVVYSTGDMEMIYALGESVVGRPTIQGPIHPKEAQEAEEVGNAHEINFEILSSLNPDLVIANAGLNEKDLQTLEQVSDNVLMMKADSVSDIEKSFDIYGKVFGKEKEADKYIKELQKINKNEQTGSVRSLMIYGAPGTFLAALPSSLSGDLLRLAGGDNIAKDFKKADHYPQYAQLNSERIVEANPEVIFFITHGDPEQVKEAFEAEMKQNASWSNLDAVQNGNFVTLPSDLFGKNPGPRVQDAIDVLQEELKKIEGK